MEKHAELSPREQATLEAFEPVSLSGSSLTVRSKDGAAGASFAASRMELLTSMVRIAAGSPMRVTLEAVVARAPALPTAAADDSIRNHPIVRKVAMLFDATIVRVETSGTLPVDRPQTPEDDDSSLES
ncbi:MAG: hypothetical protein JNK53_06175 [Phycisphaerae bacterium]|nr:hypothetical protein [Phycisphaerae bacterium]